MDDSYANGDMESKAGGMAEETQTPEAAEQGQEVCIKLGTDGSLTVSLETGEDEGEETPAKNVKDALRIAGQILDGLMGQAAAPAAQEEEAAFQAEMIGGVGK